MIKFIGVLTVLSLLSGVVLASHGEKALKYVPGGTVVSEKKDEFKIKTANGKIVEVELDRNGKLDEASGYSIEDQFVPGGDLKPLNEVVAMLQKEGKNLTGEWSFDRSTTRGWYYEFDGQDEKGRDLEVKVDAKTGNIIKIDRS